MGDYAGMAAFECIYDVLMAFYYSRWNIAKAKLRVLIRRHKALHAWRHKNPQTTQCYYLLSETEDNNFTSLLEKSCSEWCSDPQINHMTHDYVYFMNQELKHVWTPTKLETCNIVDMHHPSPELHYWLVILALHTGPADRAPLCPSGPVHEFDTVAFSLPYFTYVYKPAVKINIITRALIVHMRWDCMLDCLRGGTFRNRKKQTTGENVWAAN